MPYITRDFLIEFVNAIVHKEVQGKKPINLHRWWARRVGTTFHMMLLKQKPRRELQI